MISAIIPLKKNSVRVPNKNFKEFGDTTLANLKIDNLLKVSGLDEIIINSDNIEILEFFKKQYNSDKIKYVLREPYYASSECSGSEFFENIAENSDTDVLIYSPVTSPFIKPETLELAIQKFLNLNNENDSVLSVFDMKHHMWMDGKPLNYNPYYSPNSQDLPTVYKITYGFGILNTKLMIKKRNIMGDSPYFFELDEIESIDIDTDLDFEFANFIYNKKY